jgi:nitrous oxide reductase
MDNLMDQNSDIAELYQDSIHTLKADKEKDWIMLNRIQDRFDQFKNKDTMHNIPESKWDLSGSEEATDQATTEFTDFEIEDLYKRYKLAKRDYETRIWTE